MSIQDFQDKIKAFIKNQNTTLVFCGIVIFVGIGAFLMGKYSNSIQNKKDIYIVNSGTQQAQTLEAFSQIQKKEGSGNSGVSSARDNLYVASSRGKLYYRIGCGGGQKIVPKNQVFFKTATDAERAGYKPSESCTP